MGTHECPGECGARVERHRYSCPSCWYRLPSQHRSAILRHHKVSTVSHALAMHDAQSWYTEHPLSTKE